MIISVDTREQKPFSFSDPRFIDTEVERGTLPVGDYSLKGLHDIVAIERKSLNDLIACLTHERARFENELRRARGFEYFAVVVEAPFCALLRGNYRSRMHPMSAVQSVASFETRYRVAFHFAYDRETAETQSWSLLRQFLRNQEHKACSILEGIGEHGEIKEHMARRLMK